MPQATYPEAARAVPRRPSPKGRRTASLFGLAPSGVYPATTVASGAVRSYRTISPLPINNKLLKGGLLSAALAVSLHCPGVTWHSAL